MDLTSALIITLISMAFSAFFSGMEIAFISSNRVRVGVDSQKTGLTNRIINMFYRHQDMFISTMLVGNNIMLVIYGMGMAILLEPLIMKLVGGSEALTLFVQTIVSTGIILITGEFFPKTIFRINPNLSLRHSAASLFVIYLILYPISWFASFLSKIFMRLFGVRASTPRSALLTVGELDDYLQTIEDKDGKSGGEMAQEMKIFRNALDFSNTLLRDCMVPRNEIVAVDIESTDRDRLRRRFTATGLSKIIVYRGDIDDVVGYIHVNELFDTAADWKQRIKPVEYAPESMLANAMMRKMLSEKKSIAVIVDEFGGTGGLVTLEDLVEEIFGDFEDEHDKRHLVEERLPDGSYKFSGRMEIERLNEEYHLDIPESEEYQTLAGYILFLSGNLPQQGDVVRAGGLALTVLKNTATRIELVKVSRDSGSENAVGHS